MPRGCFLVQPKHSTQSTMQRHKAGCIAAQQALSSSELYAGSFQRPEGETQELPCPCPIKRMAQRERRNYKTAEREEREKRRKWGLDQGHVILAMCHMPCEAVTGKLFTSRPNMKPTQPKFTTLSTPLHLILARLAVSMLTMPLS